MRLAKRQPIPPVIRALERLSTDVRRDDQTWMGDGANSALAPVVLQHLKPKLLLPGANFNLP